MRTSSPALKSFLAARTPCWIAELFTVTLADGVTTFSWTSFDRNLSDGITTWVALGNLVKRNRMTVRNTVEVPECEVALMAADSVTIEGVSLKTAVHNGIFDGATFSLWRAFMPSPGDTSLGIVLMFAGRLSQAVVGADGVTFTAKGDNVLMNQQTPRNLYQTTCEHSFCDTGCALLKANYTTTNTVGTGATTTFIPWGSVPGTPALYILGVASFTSGVCEGQIRTIRNATAAGVFLTYPLYGVPASGDTTSLLMGCSRTLTACQSHTDKNGNPVNNQGHFRGYPFVPQAEYGV